MERAAESPPCGPVPSNMIMGLQPKGSGAQLCASVEITRWPQTSVLVCPEKQ